LIFFLSQISLSFLRCSSPES